MATRMSSLFENEERGQEIIRERMGRSTGRLVYEHFECF